VVTKAGLTVYQQNLLCLVPGKPWKKELGPSVSNAGYKIAERGVCWL